MAKIKITIENDLGEEVSSKSYELKGKLENLEDIEDAVIDFSSSFLPDLTKEILIEKQDDFIKKKPKK